MVIGFVNKYKNHRKVAFGKLASVFLVISGTIAIAGGLFRVRFHNNDCMREQLP